MNTASTSNETQTPSAGDGYQVGQSPTDKVGFYGTDPIVQPAPSGNTTTVTAGSTTSVFVNSTFNGGSGTAYTVGDVVKALKQLGILAA